MLYAVFSSEYTITKFFKSIPFKREAAVSTGVLSEDGVSEDGVSEDEVSEDEVSEDEVSEDEVSEDEVSEDEVSEDEVSEDGVSEDEVSGDEPSEGPEGLEQAAKDARTKVNVRMSARSRTVFFLYVYIVVHSINLIIIAFSHIFSGLSIQKIRKRYHFAARCVIMGKKGGTGMEKGIKYGGAALFVLYGVYPLGVLIAKLFGYQLEMFNMVIWNCILIALTAAYFVLRLKAQDPFEEEEENPTEEGIPVGLLPVVGMANWLCNVTKGTGVIATSLLAFFCTFVLGMKFAKIKWAKTAGIMVSGALLMPMAFLSVVGLGFGKADDVVLNTVYSPNETYYVQIVDDNQGAEGGNILVKAYENSGFDAGVFSVYKRPVVVYVAKYEKTAPSAAIEWDGEQTVLIDEKAYSVFETYTEVN